MNMFELSSFLGDWERGFFLMWNGIGLVLLLKNSNYALYCKNYIFVRKTNESLRTKIAFSIMDT